jgi:threonine synthase
MKKIGYNSTRGNEKNVESSYAIVKGLANDGGLFVPNQIPKLSKTFEELKNLSYQEIACYVLGEFLTDFTEEEIKHCVYSAYDHKFDNLDIAPIVKKNDYYYLELFHGSTIAFKDMALSILPYLMTTAAKKQGITNEIAILTATSGDTGKAALAGFGDVEGTKIIVFYPKNGVSKIQERQMTTSEGENTLVVGIDGNFDDAQNGVKAIFNDQEFNQKLNEVGVQLSSANSINIGRLLPQVVYYVYAYSRLVKEEEIQAGELINVVVPTGNFGNILAAYYAKEMGLPMKKLICASNDNKVLYDFFETGTYDRRRDFVLTISPSMDILISSNLERLIYTIADEDAAVVNELMESLQTEGQYTITEDMKAKLDAFYPAFATEAMTQEAIKDEFEDVNYMLDPHTAVAKVAFDKYNHETKDTTRTVIVSTASPYKFTKSTLVALDNSYENIDDFELLHELKKVSKVNIPEAVKDIEKRPILHSTVCEKGAMADVVLNFLKK